MLPKTSLGIIGATEGLGYLVNSIVIVLLCLLLALEFLSRESVERQTHIDAVEPYLVSVNLLVPPNALFGARVVLQLLEEDRQSLAHLLLREQTVILQQETCRTDVVEVELVIVVALYRTVLMHHETRVFCHIVREDGVAIGFVAVEDSLQLQTYAIVPPALRTLLGVVEVEVYGVRHSLHLAPCHPLRIALERRLLQHFLAIDDEIVEMYVVRTSRVDDWLVGNTLKVAVGDVDIVNL